MEGWKHTSFVTSQFKAKEHVLESSKAYTRYNPRYKEKLANKLDFT